MTPDLASNAVVSWIGIVLQLVGSVLCLGLGLVLRKSLTNRRWMTCWVSAFAAISVAVAALLVRYYLLPLLPIESLQRYETRLVSALYAVYIAGKLGFFFCLLTGTWAFVSRRPLSRAVMGAGLGAIGLAALVVFLVPTNLDPLMALQAVVAVPVFVACAALLYRRPLDRRTRGSRLLAGVFLALAVLWLLYIPGFLRVGSDGASAVGVFLKALTFHNSYLDVLLEFMLGFGMILAVLDDAFLEADEARTSRLIEVAASEARLAQIIRAASEGILLLDASRRIVHCNPAALEILGCGEPDVLGESFDRFVTTGAPDELWVKAGERIQRTATTPPGGHELRGRRCDGTEFPMEVSLRSIGEGTPGGFVLILRDRTDRVLFEEERERNRAQLAQTARLETIGRMVSGVAHELNNPLTAILAFAQDLLSQSRNPADTEALTTIVQQSQRCRAIVVDLLTFARTKRDDRELLSPLTIVRRVLPAVEHRAAARGAQLEVHVSEDLPRLEASPSGMEQVLTNLVVNAIQAVPQGGRVTIRAKVTNAFLALVVEDDGPGIPEDVLPRLFEPFFTTKGPGEGTGLGLSVSHAIVEQHGGTLKAENRNPGALGARFTINLPYLDRRSAPRKVPAIPVAELPPSTIANRAVRRVLVVDDEGPIRVAIRRFLERRGWTVEEARDGLEALGLLGLDPGGRLRTDFYDVIITDLKMPGLSGIELHDRLAAASPESVAKLVLITGDTASPDAAEFFKRLRQPLVQKPFDMRALADLLDRIVPIVAVAPPHLLTPFLGYALAVVIGLSLGLLGGGGSILTVPVLHYVLGYDLKAAIPMSLVVVGATSGFGAVNHWRAGTVNWRAALAFGPPAVVGAILGAALGHRLDPGLQLTIFAVIMLAAAVSMLLPRPAARSGSRSVLFISLVGAGVGLITGLVGVGGGFVYVPALVVLGGLAVKEAIGTSLVLIMLSCIAAVARYHGSVVFDWRAIFIFTALAFVGVVAGSRLVPHVSQQGLRKGFAVFLLGMGAVVLLWGR